MLRYVRNSGLRTADAHDLYQKPYFYSALIGYLCSLLLVLTTRLGWWFGVGGGEPRVFPLLAGTIMYTFYRAWTMDELDSLMSWRGKIPTIESHNVARRLLDLRVEASPDGGAGERTRANIRRTARHWRNLLRGDPEEGDDDDAAAPWTIVG